MTQLIVDVKQNSDLEEVLSVFEQTILTLDFIHQDVWLTD